MNNDKSTSCLSTEKSSVLSQAECSEEPEAPESKFEEVSKRFAAIVDSFHKLYYDAHERTWSNTFWLGTRVYKTPLDLWIYQELLFELKPDLVVECGTADGGSALFLASICDLIGRGRVVTVDVQKRKSNRLPRPSHSRITYLTGSSVSEEIVNAIQKEAREAGCVVVILDSDHSCEHVIEELRSYADLVTPGSYLIVEDGNINGHPVRSDFGPGPAEAITRFLSERGDFSVDQSREKFYLTFNPRGYLRKQPLKTETVSSTGVINE